MPIKNLEELTLEHNKTNRWKDLLSLLACIRGLTSEEADMAERLEMSKLTYFKYKVKDRWERLWQGNRYKFNMRMYNVLDEVLSNGTRKEAKERGDAYSEWKRMKIDGIITEKEFKDSWEFIWCENILEKDRIYKTREDFEEVMAKIEQMKKEEEKNKRERFIEAITNAINNFGSSSSDVRKEKNED